MSKQEEKTVINVTVEGILKYPKHEGNTTKYALAMNDVTKEKLEAKVRSAFGPRMLNIKPEEDSDYSLLNVKSNYDVRVLDKDGNKLDVEVYHGASVYANITIKEYTYMGRTGITAYLSGIILLDNGEATGNSFDNMMNNML